MGEFSWCRPFLNDLLDDIIYNDSAANYSHALPVADEIAEPITRSPSDWMHVILPMICTLGVSGNILNLIVLTKKRINNPFRRLERASSVGLTALAFSDLLFSITVFPYTFLEGHASTVGVRSLYVLYYRVYGISSINVFLMASTWLVVELALERFVVLYYPLHAKCVLSIKRTKLVIALIFTTSLIATLPYFFHKNIIECYGKDGKYYEIRDKWPEFSTENRILKFYQRWVWPFIAVFLPLTALLFCNVRLVQGLKRVPINRRQLSQQGRKMKVSSNRITLTLIIIVFCAIVLVSPAEILKLINPYQQWGRVGLIAASIANMLQSVNFAFNFVLYCTLDAHFRRICKNMFQGHCSSRNTGSDNILNSAPQGKNAAVNLQPLRHLDCISDRKLLNDRLYS